jgi:hypothetical protein
MILNEANSFLCFLSAWGTEQALFSKGKKRGKFGGRNRFFARFPSSSDLKPREMTREMTREMA